MSRFGLIRHVPAILVAITIVQGCANSARASVITDTSTLPLLDTPYVSSTGVGCFATAGVCVSQGTLELTSVVSSSFNAQGQDIVTNASFAGTLTNLSNSPIGTVQLSGTLEQEVLGRTSSTQTGSWTTDLVSVSLSGPVLGSTLTLVLDPSHTSSGTTSIVPLGEQFSIDSFFDVFVDLSLDTPTPLTAQEGPIALEAVATPIPAGLPLLASGLGIMGLLGTRRKRKAAAVFAG
jgi:hypothetical protein